MQTKEEFVEKQLKNLVEAIIFVDSVTSGEDKITNYPDDVRKSLGDKYSQAFAWPSLCYLIAKNSDQPPHVIETYEEFYRILMEFSYNCYLLSGAFDSGEEQKEYSLKLNEMVSETIMHWEIDPVAIFDDAMEIVNNIRRERSGEKTTEDKERKKKFWFF
jgi:hypothetical protein